MTTLTFEEFITINDQELTCIFAETGADREQGFDRDELEYDLYCNPSQYPQLITTKDTAMANQPQTVYMLKQEVEYEGSTVIGIFANEDKANEVRESYLPPFSSDVTYTVTAMEVK